jgi:hypothetical protein
LWAACLAIKDFRTEPLANGPSTPTGDTTASQRLSGFEIRDGKFEFVTMLEAGGPVKTEAAKPAETKPTETKPMEAKSAQEQPKT